LAAVVGREHLDDPIRGIAAAFLIELGGITDHRDVGLDDHLHRGAGFVAVW